jgi:hypothetical protein
MMSNTILIYETRSRTWKPFTKIKKNCFITLEEHIQIERDQKLKKLGIC